MISIPRESRPRQTEERPLPPLDCCTEADHLGLLADLEVDALNDPDIAALIERARWLLTGSTSPQSEPLWWTR